MMEHLDLTETTLVGFSISGGEVARYISTYGVARVAKAGFAGAVPPYLYKSADNPEGGLDDATINQFKAGVTIDRMAFLDAFANNFFSSNGKLMVSESQRIYARNIAAFVSPKGTLDCIHTFSYTDFRTDLPAITVPTLIIHGDADAIVPLEVSGARTHKLIPHGQLAFIKDAPHGFNLSHA